MTIEELGVELAGIFGSGPISISLEWINEVHDGVSAQRLRSVRAECWAVGFHMYNVSDAPSTPDDLIERARKFMRAKNVGSSKL
jgi:hypothetical protein